MRGRIGGERTGAKSSPNTMSLRYGIIWQYLAAMKDPDSLADVEPYADCRFESICHVGPAAYEKLTGRSAYEDAPDKMIQSEIDVLSRDVVR